MNMTKLMYANLNSFSFFFWEGGWLGGWGGGVLTLLIKASLPTVAPTPSKHEAENTVCCYVSL